MKLSLFQGGRGAAERCAARPFRVITPPLVLTTPGRVPAPVQILLDLVNLPCRDTLRHTVCRDTLRDMSSGAGPASAACAGGAPPTNRVSASGRASATHASPPAGGNAATGSECREGTPTQSHIRGSAARAATLDGRQLAATNHSRRRGRGWTSCSPSRWILNPRLLNPRLLNPRRRTRPQSSRR